MSALRIARNTNSSLPALPYLPKIKRSINKTSSKANSSTNRLKENLASLNGHKRTQQNPEKILYSTPFLLYIFKKKANKETVIEPSLIMLYWEEKSSSSSKQKQGRASADVFDGSSAFNEEGQREGSPSEDNLKSPSSSSGEGFEDRWQISSSKIPVSFEADTEQIAFALAFVTKRGVEFIEDLNCMVNLGQLKVDEQAQLSNCTFSNNHNNTSNKNRIVLHLERKGSTFLEISTINIHLTPAQIKKIASLA